jgi:hypothetical protein
VTSSFHLRFAIIISNDHTSKLQRAGAVQDASRRSVITGKQALNYRKHLNATTSHNTPAPVPPVTDEKPPATDTK